MERACRHVATGAEQGTGTDEYTFSGTCPEGFTVINNHRGYDYIAEELALRGYFVVSINTNRGINRASGPADDISLIGARGRLLLRHLEQLSRWDRGSERRRTVSDFRYEITWTSARSVFSGTREAAKGCGPPTTTFVDRAARGPHASRTSPSAAF